MNVIVRKPMSLQEFLAWEERQELRYEFNGFEAIAMVGGTAEHSTIQTNLIIALGTRLRGTSCLVHGSHLKIEVMGHIRYPDAFVVCTPLPKGTTRVQDPVVIFEILSESTAQTDRVDKNVEYCATASVKRYVILNQDRIAATVFSRRDKSWVEEEPFTDGSILHMPEIGISIPLAELYLNVDFAAQDAAP